MNSAAPAEDNLRNQIAKMETQFDAALPQHIPVARFVRVIQTAVAGNPDLQQADRASLFESAMKAAQDGLLPDGREGALVIFNTKVRRGDREEWIKKVQWMPMVAGIMKKARNSGQISTIVSRVVFAGDKFRNWIDDDGEHIEYQAADDSDPNTIRCVFAMAKLKDGAVEIEVLKPSDVEKIRQASKSKDGPAWKNWWDEMARKSAIRRLSKRLPLSSDLDDLIRRDDELYDFKNTTSLPPDQRINNPLRDEIPADEGKVIEHDASTEQRNEDDFFRGDPKLFASADLVISRSGKILKDRDGARPVRILDQRWEESQDWFHNFEEWSEACAESKLTTDFGLNWKEPDVENEDDERSQGEEQDGDGTAGEAQEGDDGFPGDADSGQTRNNAPRATAGQASGGSKPDPKAERKPALPYDDAESYMAWMREQLKAKTATAIKDAWSGSRSARADFLDEDQTVSLGKEKDARLREIKNGEGL